MGGRGSASGLSAGGKVGQLIQSFNGDSIEASDDENAFGGYSGDGNQSLIKYQGQEQDKTGSFLHSTETNIDLNDSAYADGYSYHDIPLNKLLLRLGLNGGPTVLEDADFDKYVKATGQDVIYRGWSGQAAIDRFMNATHNHVGNGVMGDGYYFSPNINTARSYAGSYTGCITRMALSPQARVITLEAVNRAYSNLSPKLQKALTYAGQGGSGRTYGSNDGQAQLALKLGYNVIKSGDYYVAITGDALVTSKKII